MTGYWECTLRETEHVDANTEVSLGTGINGDMTWHPSLWSNCWEWQSQLQGLFPGYQHCLTSTDPISGYGLCYELDQNEIHGAQVFDYSFEQGLGNVNWGGFGPINGHVAPPAQPNWTGNWCSRAPCSIGPVADPSQYNTFGELITYHPLSAPSPHCIWNVDGKQYACFEEAFYLNNQWVGTWFYGDGGDVNCGTAGHPACDPSDHTVVNQRSYAIIDMSLGCFGKAEGGTGGQYCNNIAMTESNSGGSVLLTFDRADCSGNTVCFSGFNPNTGVAEFNGGVLYLKGAGGNLPDGNYTFTVTNPAGNPATATLQNFNTGATIAYSGPYTGGTINPMSSAEAYVKSYKHWVGCTNWRNGPCTP
jgi:hypothetical protein